MSPKALAKLGIEPNPRSVKDLLQTSSPRKFRAEREVVRVTNIKVGG